MKPTKLQFKQCLAVVVGAIAGGFLCASAQAVVLYQTSGQQDPTVSMGALLGFEATQSPLPVTSSGNDGEDYWRLSQAALAGDFGRANYRKDMVAADTLDPSGWTLTYRAKLGRAADAQFNSYMAVVDSSGGGRVWVMDLVGGAGVNNPHVGFAKPGDAFPAFSQVSAIDPTLAYHTYQMIYDPGTTKVGFYMDGTLLDSELTYSGGVGQTRIEWNRGQGTGGDSATQWSLIQFETGMHVVPEPSSMALIGLGGLALAISRRRNRKNS